MIDSTQMVTFEEFDVAVSTDAAVPPPFPGPDTTPPGGVAGDAELVAAMLRSVSTARVRSRLAALSTALQDWNAAGRKGQAAYPYSEVRELLYDLRAMAMDADVVPTAFDPATGQRTFDFAARNAVNAMLLKVGMVARFPSMFQAPGQEFRGRSVVSRQLELGEDIYRVAKAVGVSWEELVALNALRWPYTANMDAPGVLVPGKSFIKVPGAAVQVQRVSVATDRAGGAIGIDFKRDRDTTDYVDEGDGYFTRATGPDLLVQALLGQFETVQGFFEDAPDYGAIWLRSGRGLGNFITQALQDLFFFHLARMVTFDGRLQSPEAITSDYTAGQLVMRFDTRTSTGERIQGLEVTV